MKQEINKEPKRHHYVPRTYLSHFALKNRNEYQIHVMDKKTKNIFKTNIKNIAVEKDFYTVETYEDKYCWEKYYSDNIEPIMGNTLLKLNQTCNSCLIQDNTKVIDEKTKKHLSIIMAVQLLRGVHTRNFERNIFQDTIPELFGQVGYNNNMKENTGKIEFLFKEVAMRTSVDEERIKTFAYFFYKRVWMVYKLIGDEEFITSDNPIMIMNSQTFNTVPFKNGIANPNVYIYYPISPKLLLGIYSFRDEQYILTKNDCKLIFLDDKKFVKNINKKHYEQCYRQVYAYSKETLEKLK